VKRAIRERTSNALSHSCFASLQTFYLDSHEEDEKGSRKKSSNHVYTTRNLSLLKNTSRKHCDKMMKFRQ